MKKFGLILLVFLLCACGGDLSSPGENVFKNNSVEDGSGDESRSSEDLSDEDSSSKDAEGDSFDLSEPWAVCYRDILDNKLPYLIYTDWEGKVFEKYLNDLYGDGDLGFAIYNHKDFSFPLLILRYRLTGPGPYENIYAIVYYQEDGSYKTFSVLDPGQFTQFANGIYEDSEGKLFIDDASNDDIFAINKVGDELLINYCYRPGTKGFASRLAGGCFDDEPGGEVDDDYQNGMPGFLGVSLIEARAEDFPEVAYNDFKNSIKEIPMTDLTSTNISETFAGSDGDKASDSDFKEPDVFEEIKNGPDYGFLRKRYDENYIYNLEIDGKDMGQIALVSYGGSKGSDTYTDVGYLNMKLVKIWRAGDFADDGALAQIDGEDSTAFVKQHEGGWYYGVFPGAMEFDYDYYNFYNVTLVSFYDFDAEETIYAIKHPAETVIFGEDSMSIDLKTLSKLFGFSYSFDLDNLKIILDTKNPPTENPFIEIPRGSYGSLEELLEDNFGPNGKYKYEEESEDLGEKDEEVGEDKAIEDSGDAKEEKKEDKPSEEEWLIKNITNIKPKVIITKDGEDEKWDKTSSFKIEIKNKKDYPKDAKFIISSKYIDNKKVNKDGYSISGGPYEIGTKKRLSKKGADYIEEIKIKVFYGDKWSEEYSYYYNPALNYFEKEMAKNGLKDDYNKVIDKIKELRDYDPIVYDKNDKKYKYREEYAFIIPKKTGEAKSPTEKALVRQWFTFANNMQLKEYSKALENVKGNKVNKSNLGIFGKMFPWARSREIAKNITEIISVENNNKIVNQDGREYLLKIDSIGVGAALTTGKIYMREGEDWKEMKRIGLLTATPKVDDASIKFTENYIIALGFQSLGGIINKPGLVKMATQTNFERGVSFAQYIDGLTKFSDKILESNLKKYDFEDLSKILGLTSNGKDFFSYLDTLKRMNTNLNKNTADLSLEETREMVDDSIVILKYLGKLK
ncbi:hypothetical protein K8P03_04745 [Anaerococcus murdochii]|uniref:Lipoprotein n=1 Tax=Anaerococcus murdochii TaxID=411577 RepID=A0ABS7SYL0_9FIRM|nr:hypothetical protein [Anaerococcus murdochii]MBZ2386605.1 hypothetical protein [Anaerococcus murdochii]